MTKDNKPKKPKKSLVENDEYFYRDQEMMRPIIESEEKKEKENEEK